MTANSAAPLERPLSIEARGEGLLAVCFQAMASPCEVLLPAANRADARQIGALVAHEAWRVETKYSRYRDDSVVSWIHRHRGAPLVIDAETAALLDFAEHCFEVSDGMFDITSGVLRRAWRFDGSDRLPDDAAIADLLPFVGFGKLQWKSPVLTLQPGMELDFGGIGKEYAVDCAYSLVAARWNIPFLINFGGDLRASRAPPSGAWNVGVERPDSDHAAGTVLELELGALATSGDSHRYLLKNGTRYGHILDPRTGWPVPNSPRSVTVAASSCTEAGLLSTLALLRGAGAEAFLAELGTRYWLNR